MEKKDLELINKAIEKHPERFKELTEKLRVEDEYILPAVLQEKLDTIKDSPLLEEKIAAKMKESVSSIEAGEIQADEVNLEITESLYTVEEIESLLGKYDLKDIAEFGSRVIDKVFSLKDKDGEFKEVPSHKELKPLAYLERKELRKITNKTRNIFVGEKKYSEENLKKFQLVQEETREYILNKCKYLEIDKMSDWEINLLVDKMKANATGNYEPAMGKN